MNGNEVQHFVGIDIGSSTVRVVVLADNGQDRQPAVIGYGAALNLGMRRGTVVQVDDVAEAIVTAISAAERLSGTRISRATVNINGTHVSGSDSKGVIAISGVNRQIGEEDRARVEEAATVVKLPPNREIVQVFAKGYSLDGQANIKDPVGMSGVRLEVDTQLVTAATPNLRSLDLALEKAQVGIDHHTVSSLAAAEAVLTRQQREAGTAVVDIGAGTTNIAILEDGEIQYVGVLPIGGTHLTNDLAIGLKTDLDIAEKVKLEHASLAKPDKKQIKFKQDGKEYSFASEEVAMVTEARMEELFEYVNKEFAKARRAGKLPGGVVLTGGGSKINGLAEFARDQLALPVRMGSLQPIGGLVDTIDDPSYFTAIGLSLLDMLLPSDGSFDSLSMGDRVSSLFGSLKKRLRY